MQRLIEQPAGEGEVLDGGRRLGRVHYHLAIYQQFSSNEDEPIPASLEVEGRLTPIDRIDFAPLIHRHAELTLRLGDGRQLELSLVDATGTIRSTGRSLYKP